MTSPETVVLRQRVIRVITRRVGSSTAPGAVAVAARLTHDDLTAVFAPLISAAGVDALWGRSLDLARREYPADERNEDVASDEPFAQASLWLVRQDPAVVIDAAAAMFAAFADLLTALIGEPLTTRYLEKAWPDGFSDVDPKGKKA
jgi:hypothetical protein